ncbi:hypothetical protein J6590_012331 [Homalodisca vitripennis]|nr:hypothetical protein J6590_012331 [Homalodisca vitripennis]
MPKAKDKNKQDINSFRPIALNPMNHSDADGQDISFGECWTVSPWMLVTLASRGLVPRGEGVSAGIASRSAPRPVRCVPRLSNPVLHFYTTSGADVALDADARWPTGIRGEPVVTRHDLWHLLECEVTRDGLRAVVEWLRAVGERRWWSLIHTQEVRRHNYRRIQKENVTGREE